MADSSLGIIALLQARMSSHRLPGKVLLPCGTSTFLGQQIKRLRSSKRIAKVVVLTSSHKSDDAISNFCTNLDVPCYRGSLHDVFQRFYDFLNRDSQGYRFFARLTADCPFTCVDIIDELIRIAIEGDLDYVSNTLLPTFPDGMDAEIVKISSFLRLGEFNLNEYEREHVTPGLYFRPREFSLANLSTSPNLSHYRWTLDKRSDAAFLSLISDEYPDIVASPNYRRISDLIHSRGGTFPKTDPRKAISVGPWTEYSFLYA